MLEYGGETKYSYAHVKYATSRSPVQHVFQIIAIPHRLTPMQNSSRAKD